MSKSNVAVSEIQFLGHKITKDEIFVFQERVEAINRLPLPRTVCELGQALVFITFQHRFIKGAARIFVSLTKYLQGHVKNKDELDLDDEVN